MNPQTYRKLPVEIQAMRYEGTRESALAIVEWIGDDGKTVGFTDKENSLSIRTLEGDMLVRKGDYVIRGVQGEHYPCKPDIFNETYEKVT